VSTRRDRRPVIVSLTQSHSLLDLVGSWAVLDIDCLSSNHDLVVSVGQDLSCTSLLDWLDMPSSGLDRVSRSTVTQELQAMDIVPVHCPMSLLTILALYERLDQVTSTLCHGLMVVIRQTPTETATAKLDAMS